MYLMCVLLYACCGQSKTTQCGLFAEYGQTAVFWVFLFVVGAFFVGLATDLGVSLESLRSLTK